MKRDEIEMLCKIMGCSEAEAIEAHRMGEELGFWGPDGEMNAKGRGFAVEAATARPDWLAEVVEGVKRTKD